MKCWALAFFATVAPLAAQSIHIKLDPARTNIGFTLGDVLHTVHGTFKVSEGMITVDLNTATAAGRIVVSAASGASGSGARDGRMRKSVLEAPKFPDITFTPEHLIGHLSTAGDASFQLQGQFGIHGNSHPLTIAVTSHIDGKDVKARASFDIPYVAWGMKDPSTLFLKVNPTVHIDLDASGSIN